MMPLVCGSLPYFYSAEKSGRKDDEPKTGDAAPIELYATLTMIAGFAYLLLYFTDRKRGMSEETKNELVSWLVGWAKQGGRIRKCLALAAIFVLLVYYHSIGKKSMENKRKKTVKILLLAGMAVCLIPIGQAYDQSVRHRAQQEELREMVTEINVEYSAADVGSPNEIGVSVLEDGRKPNAENSGGRLVSGSDAESSGGRLVSGSDAENSDGKSVREADAEGGGQIADQPQMLEQYAKLYEKNKDLEGWLSIEGMKIDYPVMQNEDNTYYLHHDFYGEDSKYGCLYVKEQADLDAGTNFIIYGHNMKDGSMFGDLDLYLKESFYKEHPVISFDTLYEERTYDIIAVFRSQVYRADDEVFKYYQFYEADTQEEFEDFYDNIKKLSLYDTGVEAAFGDTFLTLSTCAYHVPDGRLVVVAKRRE